MQESIKLATRGETLEKEREFAMAQYVADHGELIYKGEEYSDQGGSFRLTFDSPNMEELEEAATAL